MLEFCPVCRRLLNIKKENEKIIGFCSCGFKRFSGIEVSSTENLKPKLDDPDKYKIIEDKKGYDYKCIKCGFDACEVIDLGERSTDENGVTLFKCKRCGFSSRNNA